MGVPRQFNQHSEQKAHSPPYTRGMRPELSFKKVEHGSLPPLPSLKVLFIQTGLPERVRQGTPEEKSILREGFGPEGPGFAAISSTEGARYPKWDRYE